LYNFDVRFLYFRNPILGVLIDKENLVTYIKKMEDKENNPLKREKPKSTF